MKLKLSHSGITLLEILLVLAIMASIMLLGLKRIQSFQRDAEISKTQFNVNALFQAGAFFYQANCRRQFDPVAGAYRAGTGLLDPDPDTTPDPDPNTPVTVTTLEADGYLEQDLKFSTIVNTQIAGGEDQAYIVQYNRADEDFKEYFINNGATKVPNIGEIVVWTIQVAVLLRNPAPLSYEGLRQMLNADCISTTATNISGQTIVTPCSDVGTAPTSNVYAVWERLPSYAAPLSATPSWVFMPSVKKFNQQYENSNMLYLESFMLNPYPATKGYPDRPQDHQLYLCGS